VNVAENLADTPRIGVQTGGGLTRCVNRFGGHVLPCAVRNVRSGTLRNCFPGVLPGSLLERCPATLSNSCGPCAVRTLSRRGRENPRAHVTVRRSRYLLDLADIVLFQQGASHARV